MKRESYTDKYIKKLIGDTRIGHFLRTKKQLKKGKLLPIGLNLEDLFPDVAKVKINLEGLICPRIGIHRDATEYNGHIIIGSYYLRYKSFLENNNINYNILNLFRSDWLEQCQDLDLIIIAYNSEPSRLNELYSKVYILEKFHNKVCYPSSSDLWSYEDKIRLNYLFREYGVPYVKTFITHDYNEAMDFIKKANYPFVSKIKTGSCSRGIELIKNYRQAEKIVKKNFGLGRKALWTYSFEKDYVYFQDYIADSTYDLRIFIVGDIILGYKRRMKGKDFRASGTGLLDRSLFPYDAIEIARYLKEKWDTTILAVDFVDTNNSKEHLVIEASISFGLDYPEYLEYNGKRVFYQITDKGLELKEGCFWIQDFILKELINKTINIKRKENGENTICLKWEF